MQIIHNSRLFAGMCRVTLLAILIGGILIESVAQELKSISINGEIPPGFYKAGIRYGSAKGDSLHIKWSRTAEADTFWVYRANLHLQYITDAKIRTVWYSQPMKYERRMATHHLREYILESSLKFNNLEDLSKNRNPRFLDKDLHEYFTAY